MRRLIVLVLILFGFAGGLRAEEWLEEKGTHFIVQYAPGVERGWVKEVLRAAEQDYRRIARRIGYVRYKEFWTWDQRVKIVVYPDKATFLARTGQPEWSEGGAGRRDHRLSYSRHILTYKQEGHFFEGVLPHEISHLMLWDFIGDRSRIPLWLDEGVAQLNERSKRRAARQIVRQALREGKYLSFTSLFGTDIRRETDPVKVRLFYAQSISILDFLIERHGSRRFGQFCRELKNGKNLEAALQAAYTASISSIKDLEQQWRNSFH